MAQFDVIIVGAGVAGLSAALYLQNEGLSVKLFEAADKAGGRVRTDRVEGFLLDRGFQVLLSAYPEVKRLIDYDALNARPFYPGVMVRYADKYYRMGDPLRAPLGGIASLGVPFFSWEDKAKILMLRRKFSKISVQDIFQLDEMSTYSYLTQQWNFNKRAINAFFRPFFGGVLLDYHLQTSNRMFGFTYKMFAEGDVLLPEQGIEAIPRQLVARLLPDTLVTRTKVAQLNSGQVVLESGEKVSARAILLATDAAGANRLLPQDVKPIAFNAVRCLYFTTAGKSPMRHPILMLNGESEDDTQYINNVCIPSVVQPNYAPHGHHLVSVSVIKPSAHLSDAELLQAVRSELQLWFGASARYWKHLRTYSINQALPKKTVLQLPEKYVLEPLIPNVYAVGDYLFHPSLQGAMSGARQVANALSWELALQQKP